MPNLTTVTVTAGVPTAGTGTVSTLDNLVGTSGSPSAQVLTTQRTAIVPVASSALEANHVLKASAGTLYSFQANTGSTSGWVLLFNATSAPADGAVTPIKAWQVDINSTLGVSFQPPISCTTGITLSFSTTGPFTKTASSTAYFSGEIV